MQSILESPGATRVFEAYGLRIALQTASRELLDAFCDVIPYCWQPVSGTERDVTYRLEQVFANTWDTYQLSCDADLIAEAAERATVLAVFIRHAELLTATRARNYLFVHAGVVSWRGQAILIPGRSFSGKTTLVKALVEAGACYYSDEFAVLDREGLVHPYALPLSIRDNSGYPTGKLTVDSFGGQIGHDPLPVGLVVVTRHQFNATWRPRALSPGRLLLALMDNTVAARGDPAHSMPILRAALARASGTASVRGEAEPTARAILQRLTP